jgi:hypothetical protein
MWKTRIAATLLVLVSAAHLIAWNGFGHMTVAAAAFQNLTPAARAIVTALLKLNPNYPQWVAGVAASDKDMVAFIVAATWPDAIKGMKGFKNDGDTPPPGPAAGRNIGYTDKLQHRYWHFIDTPFSPDGTPLKNPVPPNAQTQIAAFRATLASASAKDRLKSYDLVWLEHLVGDVHQPLHATSRFDAAQPNGDHGGNDVRLCAAPCKDELHLFWDDVLGISTDPLAAQTAAAALPPPDATLAAIALESTWIDESFQAAQKSVYIPPIGIGAGPFTLDATYKADAQKLASQRVALAGARLANLINAALK